MNEILLLNQRVAKLNPKNKELLPYFYFMFRQRNFKGYLENISTGTAQQNLSNNNIIKMEISFNKNCANKVLDGTIENNNLIKILDNILLNPI